jgi:hypothetical protein
MTMEKDIRKLSKHITDMLIKKNKAYGESGQNPINIFSKLDSQEAIKARIDDKLSRIKKGGITPDTEDTLFDLVGYLLLLIYVRDRDANKL